MIQLEYITTIAQDGTTSIAAKSHRQRNQNPGLDILFDGTNYQLNLHGLQMGRIEQVTGTPRANHLDVYVGLTDLISQRGSFPASSATSSSVSSAPNPTGTQRTGGNIIRMVRPQASIDLTAVDIRFEGYRNTAGNATPVLRVDVETAPYPINGGSSRQVHLGVGDFGIRSNNSLTIPRVTLTLSPPQYTALLSAIDAAIYWHNNNP